MRSNQQCPTCDKPLTHYRKDYPAPRWAFKAFGPTYEMGWRCKPCGTIRVPAGPPLSDKAYQHEVEAIRARLKVEGEPDL